MVDILRATEGARIYAYARFTLLFSVNQVFQTKISTLFLLSWWTLSLELPGLQGSCLRMKLTREESATEGETLRWYEHLDLAMPDSIPDIFSK